MSNSNGLTISMCEIEQDASESIALASSTIGYNVEIVPEKSQKLKYTIYFLRQVT